MPNLVTGINARFYYKAHGITPASAPFQCAGPVEAKDEYSAMGLVRQLSTTWNCSRITDILIYSVDEFGVVSQLPVLSHKDMIKAMDDASGIRSTLYLPSPKGKTSHNVTHYTTVPAWATVHKVPESYPVVRLKESRSSTHDADSRS